MVSGDGLTEMYRGIIEQYPVASIEDPFDQVRHCRSLLLLLLLLLVVVLVLVLVPVPVLVLLLLVVVVLLLLLMVLLLLLVAVLLLTAAPTRIAQTAASSINCSQLTSLKHGGCAQDDWEAYSAMTSQMGEACQYGPSTLLFSEFWAVLLW